MYTNHKSALYVVAMLKAQGISKIVISPGTSHNAMVRSIDEDAFFETYSVTDERSAAFFAIGIAQETHTPVAIMCTSGTATCNYISAVTEAFHRNIPLVVITADKHPHFLDQREDLMINQPTMFRGITKWAVTLPEEIHNEQDDWYCRRLLNEAFLEMNHHGTGPIHINVPITRGVFAIGDTFTTPVLPEINVIRRLDWRTPAATWKKIFDALKNKRILILCGQNIDFSEERAALLDKISKGFNCVLAHDSLANLHCERAVAIEKVHPLTNEHKPDLVISLDGSIVANVKYYLKAPIPAIEHWLVHEKGTISDPYRKLSYVIEASSLEFLRIMAQHSTPDASSEYFQQCSKCVEHFQMPALPYSNCYICRQTMALLPAKSMLHLGNSSIVRIAQYFSLDESIRIFCNRGVHGIDGSMSAFIGQAAVSERLSFLMLGDLSFFYDLNALWNRHVGCNVRILLFNNGGASMFHFNTRGLENFPSLDRNAAAGHESSAKGWVESRGFTYLSASTKEEIDRLLPVFVTEKSDAPILFEVFTDKDTDASVWHSIIEAQKAREPQEAPAGHHQHRGFGIKTKIKKKLKSVILDALGEC